MKVKLPKPYSAPLVPKHIKEIKPNNSNKYFLLLLDKKMNAIMVAVINALLSGWPKRAEALKPAISVLPLTGKRLKSKPLSNIAREQFKTKKPRITLINMFLNLELFNGNDIANNVGASRVSKINAIELLLPKMNKKNITRTIEHNKRK